MQPGKSVVYIDHESVPHDAMVIVANQDGSFDVAVFTSDPKRQQKATSADWVIVFDRITHQRHVVDKLKALGLAENEEAQNAGRDASFKGFIETALPESIVEGSSRLKIVDGKVETALIFASEADDLPEPYVAAKPAVPAEATAPATSSEAVTDTPAT